MSNIWDDPDMRADGDYVAFNDPGDKVVGEILGITIHTFPDNKRAPKLYIRTDDGEEKTLTAGQFELKKKLGELRPETGDRIAVVFTGAEKLEGGKTLKRFDVQVQRGAAAVSAGGAGAGVSASELL